MFTKDSREELKCKVSEDFKRVFLNNDTDTIYYEDRRQMQLSHFKSFNVLKIIEVPYRPTLLQMGEELMLPMLEKNHSIQNQVESTTAFLCICENPYDNFINVFHSHDPEFIVRIDR
jgi:hypothetical protein